jgi:hypothetical protein
MTIMGQMVGALTRRAEVKIMDREQEQTAANRILAEGWRLTREILALKGMKIPDTIDFQIDGKNHIRATRVATLEELAKAAAALGEAIERRSEGRPSVTAYMVISRLRS